MISLKIRDENRVRASWWANFTSTLRKEHLGLGLDFYLEDWMNLRRQHLEKSKAHYTKGSVFFEIEQVAAMFILRWS